MLMHNICNLRFADDIDLLGRSDEELRQLTDILEKTAAGWNQLQQKQNSRQQHQAKTIYQHPIYIGKRSQKWKRSNSLDPRKTRSIINLTK